MDNQFRPVLITGADTGFGRLATETLAQRGFKVYATVYLDQNLDKLNQLDNVKSFRLDVTNEDDVVALKNWVIAQGEGLHAVVNNAGIGETWPLIESTTDEIYRVFNVNLMGVIRVTTAMAPLLAESQGRVITIGSLSGTIPSKMIGAYSVSKFAVEAYTDIINFELRKFGIKAITIKPGNFKTDITKARIHVLKSRRERFERSQYKSELQPLYDNLDNPAFIERESYETPERVIDAIADALYSNNPKSKYLVVTEQESQAAISWMCRVIAQLNQNHEYSLDRDVIHQYLDKQLNKFQ